MIGTKAIHKTTILEQEDFLNKRHRFCIDKNIPIDKSSIELWFIEVMPIFISSKYYRKKIKEFVDAVNDNNNDYVEFVLDEHFDNENIELIVAVYNNDLLKIPQLLKRVKNEIILNTCLKIAVLFKYIAVANILLKANVDPNNYDSKFTRDYPIFLSVMNTDIDMTKLLLFYGANINITDIKGFNVLRYAIEYLQFTGYGITKDEYFSMIHFLIDNNVDIHNKNDELLRLAIKNEEYKLVELLLNKGMNVTEYDIELSTKPIFKPGIRHNGVMLGKKSMNNEIKELLENSLYGTMVKFAGKFN